MPNKKYLTSDFEGRQLTSPGKTAFFEFLAMRAGGWKKIRDRIDRGCSPIAGQLRGQEEMFMSLVDLDDFTHRVLDFYDQLENAHKKSLPLDEKMRHYAKVKIQGMSCQFRKQTDLIYSLHHNQPEPPSSRFFNDDTPTTTQEQVIQPQKQDLAREFAQVQEVIELLSKFNNTQKGIFDILYTSWLTSDRSKWKSL